MALLLGKAMFNIAFSSHLRTSILKLVRGPNMMGSMIDIGKKRM